MPRSKLWVRFLLPFLATLSVLVLLLACQQFANTETGMRDNRLGWILDSDSSSALSSGPFALIIASIVLLALGLLFLVIHHLRRTINAQTPHNAQPEFSRRLEKSTDKLHTNHAIQDILENSLDNEEYYLAVIDIDNFKRINNTYGHKAGDQVILKAETLINSTLGQLPSMNLAGCEHRKFCTLFQARTEQEAFRYNDELRSLIERETTLHQGNEISFTVSIGVTNIVDSQDATLNQARQALQKAKDAGKNRVVLYQSE